MAAIDKMHVKDWYTFDNIVRWSIAHYPRLLNYFYNWRMTYKDWADCELEYIQNIREINKRDLKKIGGKNITPHKGAKNLMKHYKESANYDCSYEQALWETTEILDTAHKSDWDLAEEHSRAITNTPCSIDRKLLWICPIPEVRKYLYEQCGYKKHWEWLYKIFWRGKKEFGNI